MKYVRTLCYIPAHRRDWVFGGPRKYAADGYILDLEDSVPKERKQEARETLRESYSKHKNSDCVIAARVNSPETDEFEKDLEAIVYSGLDAIVVPKVREVEDIIYLESILKYLEKSRDINRKIELILVPETAAGISNVYQIAKTSTRVAAVAGFGHQGDASGDIYRSLGLEASKTDHEIEYVQSKIPAEARAAGVDQVTISSYMEIDNEEALRSYATIAKQKGYTGGHVIHPDQIEPVNEVFTPDKETVEYYQGLIEAMENARKEGVAAIEYKGDMVDKAHLKSARKIIDRAEDFGVID